MITDDPLGAGVWALWSSTRVGGDHYIHTIEGQSHVVTETHPSVSVRCVRGTPPSGALVVQFDGETVLDPKSGLEWQRDRSQVPDMSFECALAYCESLVLAGADDWRLPSIKELASLVDERFSPALDPVAFPATMSSPPIEPMLMSSTIVRDSHNLGNFWGISLTPTKISRSQVVPYVYSGDYPYPFRCVRG